MSYLPSDEYIKQVEREVERFDRKGLHDTCWHEDLARIRALQKVAKAKEKQPKETDDGEQDL